jgi:bacterioferritin-associated ferredoxin
MVVCLCRNISDTRFKNKEELRKRLCAKDIQCGSCLEYYKLNKNNLTKQKK